MHVLHGGFTSRRFLPKEEIPAVGWIQCPWHPARGICISGGAPVAAPPKASFRSTELLMALLPVRIDWYIFNSTKNVSRNMRQK